MLTRFSRKRQSIIEYLCATDKHPSAEQIYAHLKPEYPDLSLGTVYRNLNQLIEEGLVISVGTVLGKERYDGNTKPHTHVVCRKCGDITDLFTVNLPPETVLQAAECSNMKIEYSNLQFVGICRKCREEKC